MFTGIVTDVGEVIATEQRGDRRIHIRCGYDMSAVDLGASIACSGVCLTVVEKAERAFAVDVSGETLRATNLGAWQVGTAVNLERALRVGDELGGHIVTGHVDCVGEVAALQTVGDSLAIEIAMPKEHAGFVAEKGSVTVNGASLTVNQVADHPTHCQFGINLIPHTRAVTSFRHIEKGERVNLEFDLMVRYVARLAQVRGAERQPGGAA